MSDWLTKPEVCLAEGVKVGNQRKEQVLSNRYGPSTYLRFYADYVDEEANPVRKSLIRKLKAIFEWISEYEVTHFIVH